MRRLELLDHELRANQFDLFNRLQFLGGALLDLELNQHLGVQNVTVQDSIYNEFIRRQRLERVLAPSTHLPDKRDRFKWVREMIKMTVGAVHYHAGPQASRDMLCGRLLAGNQGLAALYLRSLQRNDDSISGS